jgi:cytochrome c6
VAKVEGLTRAPQLKESFARAAPEKSYLICTERATGGTMNRHTGRAGRGALALLLGVSFGALMLPSGAQADGGALFKGKCAACHGADGKGDTGMGRMFKIRDLGSADVQKQSNEELTKIISDGKGKMPSYSKSLKADEIKELVGFIRTLKK